jgi:hypothetical protein
VAEEIEGRGMAQHAVFKRAALEVSGGGGGLVFPLELR